MVKLSRDTELRDGLNVLAADRRELVLTLTTPRPLRKPRNPLQRRQIDEVRHEVRKQIFEQLDVAARRAFRGPVAIEMRLALPVERHAAGIVPAVKAYLDVLIGPIVFDDSTVDHLLVLREPSPAAGANVTVRCLPLSLFAADYDRFFRVLPEYEEIRGAPAPPPPADGFGPSRVWGHSHFEQHDRDLLSSNEGQVRYLRDLDQEEEDQLAEDPDADIDLELSASDWELADSDVRAYWRDHLEGSIALSRGDWLTDQGLDARDRPGPPPRWLDETRELDAADVLELRDEGPGCLVLPAPRDRPTAAGEARWPHLVEREFVRLRSGAEWRATRFRGPVALDIALRGRAGQHSDVDNVAGYVLRAFTKAFREAKPDVAAYRVYRQEWTTASVRVRLLPAPRLIALAHGMDRARVVLREERAERRRD